MTVSDSPYERGDIRDRNIHIDMPPLLSEWKEHRIPKRVIGTVCLIYTLETITPTMEYDISSCRRLFISPDHDYSNLICSGTVVASRIVMRASHQFYTKGDIRGLSQPLAGGQEHFDIRIRSSEHTLKSMNDGEVKHIMMIGNTELHLFAGI